MTVWEIFCAASPSAQSKPRQRQRPMGESAERRRLALASGRQRDRSEEHTSELQPPDHLVCRLLLEKKKDLALALNLLLRVAILSVLQATLTLPGIAAIVFFLVMAIPPKVTLFPYTPLFR